MAESKQLAGAADVEGGLEAFAAYVRKNYPSGVVIVDPDWHAPRLYRAALVAIAQERAVRLDVLESVIRAGSGAALDAEMLDEAGRLARRVMDDEERGVAMSREQAILALMVATLVETLREARAQLAAHEAKAGDLDRDALGRVVRDAWVEWAREQPNPKQSWLVAWDQLSEADREADRRIGEHVARSVLSSAERDAMLLDAIQLNQWTLEWSGDPLAGDDDDAEVPVDDWGVRDCWGDVVQRGYSAREAIDRALRETEGR